MYLHDVQKCTHAFLLYIRTYVRMCVHTVSMYVCMHLFRPFPSDDIFKIWKDMTSKDSSSAVSKPLPCHQPPSK